MKPPLMVGELAGDLVGDDEGQILVEGILAAAYGLFTGALVFEFEGDQG